MAAQGAAFAGAAAAHGRDVAGVLPVIDALEDDFEEAGADRLDLEAANRVLDDGDEEEALLDPAEAARL